MTYPNGDVLLVAFVGLVLVLGILAAADAFFVRRYSQLIGHWVQAWARRFPVLAFLLAMVLGLLIGHFYWSTPPVCPTGANGQVLQAGTDRDCVPANPSPPANT
jgi:Zn-dependent protease